jgi:glutathione S-transferase
MKLYFNPAVCSLSPHIALREAGIAVTLVKADIRAHTLEDGSDFYAVNPKGYVPVLELDDGTRLTEGLAIVEYIADLKPEANLAPAHGTMARHKLREWLTFISSEIHKGFSPLFNAAMSDDLKNAQREKLGKRFDWISEQIKGKKFLTGDQFTIADGYLFTVLGWGKWTGVDIAKWPELSAFCERVAARPAVQEAMKAEGIAA